jgi:alkylation response protein AidB-like acyl-CoA dehydrogenase
MFDVTEEQEMLREAAASFAAEKSPVSAFRALRDAGRTSDPALWAEMAAMGWAGVLIPEEHGGAGFGFRGAGIVLEELGRTLAATPFLSTAVIGASALLLGGSAAQKSALLPKIADGSVLIALACDEAAHHGPHALAASVTGGALTGAKRFVADGADAHLFLVAAKDETGAARLYLVPADAPGVHVSALAAVDGRSAADVTFEAVKLAPDAALGGPEVLEDVLDRARIGAAAEMLGVAEGAFSMTAEYLKTRTQFGQLIGAFQALQHRAASLFADLEFTRSCVIAAQSAVDARANDLKALASLAKARAAETVHLASNECVQMHGGIGMTDAADPGFYLKRARVLEHLYGSAAFHRDRYAALSGF